MHHETLKEMTREVVLKEERGVRDERGIYGRAAISQCLIRAERPATDWRTENTNKALFYDVNGWVPWKTLGWILFGRGFGPSQYIFLFYDEIQRLRQQLTKRRKHPPSTTPHLYRGTQEEEEENKMQVKKKRKEKVKQDKKSLEGPNKGRVYHSLSQVCRSIF